MAPTAVHESVQAPSRDITQLKKAVNGPKATLYAPYSAAASAAIAATQSHETYSNGVLKSNLVREGKERKPVKDDYLYEFTHNRPLPTLDVLAVDFEENADAATIATKFVNNFEVAAKSAESFASLFLDNGVWRDKVVFTWDYRTFNGASVIRDVAGDLLASAPVSAVTLLAPVPDISRPYLNLAFIPVHFSFHTEAVGASAVANLVNTRDGIKIWTLHTVIESLHGFPEMPCRDGHMVAPIAWKTQRENDTNYSDSQPDVVIIGGGHNGLMMAARLKALGVSSLIIERNARIGDNWRQRYEALSLHFPHWGDHFPYMPFPEHWPIYTPAAKLGDWLEWYYSAMELHAWTSSTVKNVTQLEDGSWSILIARNGSERNVTPKHLVMATSLVGTPWSPTIGGRETFTGTVRHSTEHDSSRDWVGKKVLVVGTSSSGFDLAYDFARRGINVTLLQRSPTYIMSLTHSVPKLLGAYEPDADGKRPDLETSDRTAYSIPTGPAEEFGRRATEELEALDHDLLQSMENAGFKTWRGQRDTGPQTLGYSKNGGFYFDAGACERIINGDIKVEQGYIDRLDGDKVILTTGTMESEREREYDLVILATGFSNTIDSIRATLGDEIASRCNQIWGMNPEGELHSAYRHCGVDNLWIMVGTLQHGRYHSKRVALRIKAMLEGVHGETYSRYL